MSSQIQTVICDNVCPALGPYSHAVKANGTAYLSGNIGVDKEGNVVSGGVTEQSEQVCKNIVEVLKTVGSELSKVVKVNVFLSDMSSFGAMNEVYAKYFSHKPARSCVAVKGLPKDVLVEIECIALY